MNENKKAGKIFTADEIKQQEQEFWKDNDKSTFCDMLNYIVSNHGKSPLFCVISYKNTFKIYRRFTVSINDLTDILKYLKERDGKIINAVLTNNLPESNLAPYLYPETWGYYVWYHGMSAKEKAIDHRVWVTRDKLESESQKLRDQGYRYSWGRLINRILEDVDCPIVE